MQIKNLVFARTESKVGNFLEAAAKLMRDGARKWLGLACDLGEEAR